MGLPFQYVRVISWSSGHHFFALSEGPISHVSAPTPQCRKEFARFSSHISLVVRSNDSSNISSGPSPWRGENQKCTKKCTFLRSRDRDRKVCFFGIVTRGDILMQGRHSSNVGPRGLQPASNTVPPSLFLASHESDISIPPLDPQKHAKCQLFFTAPRAGGD